MSTVLLKKTFFDSADAVTTLQGIPREDLLRIISFQVPPALSAAFAEMTAGWQQVDLALLAVGYCNAFHAGYSAAIADLTGENPKNIHVEYVNAQRNAGTPAPGTSPTAASPNR